MSLSNPSNSIPYTPSAPTTEFAFPYPYFNPTDLNISYENSAGVIVELVYTTDYTVSATNGDVATGATLTTTVSYTSGDTLTLYREVPYTQEYDLQEGSTIDPTSLNKNLDRIVAQTQQLKSEISRQVGHPITDPAGLDYEAPSVTDRASKVLAWDVSGNVTAQSLVASGTVTVDDTKGLGITGNQIYAVVDDTSIEFDVSGDISIKDDGVLTAHILDSNVTLAKIANIADQTVLGNLSGGALAPLAVPLVGGTGLLLDEDAMASDSDTKGSTQQAIKAYIAAQILASENAYAKKYSGVSVFTGAMPTSYQDLDLSAQVGTNRAEVHLSVEPDAREDPVFRPNGETKGIGWSSISSKGGGTTFGSCETGNIIYYTLITDASGVVEWNSSGAGSGGTVVTLLTYQVLK